MSDTTGMIDIDSTMYLFRSNSNSTDCLISAHGGYHKANLTFRVPAGCRVVFYGEHGNILGDPGTKLAHIPAVEVETLAAGEACINYELSKYQGEHGGTEMRRETYQSISLQMAFEERQLARTFNKALNSNDPTRQHDLIDRILWARTMSVLTIRNRWNSKRVWLKDAIEGVRDVMPAIRNFHCSFCRSLIGDRNANTSEIEFIPRK